MQVNRRRLRENSENIPGNWSLKTEIESNGYIFANSQPQPNHRLVLNERHDRSCEPKSYELKRRKNSYIRYNYINS